ncbi:MAG: sugar-binding protein, partial [Bacteroidota bacterium]
EDHHIITIRKTMLPIVLDGQGDEGIWQQTAWHPLDQNWLGEPYAQEDFNGRYKLCWDNDALYLLAEIKDDSLYDQFKNPLKLWWNDDSLRIFLDEDNSGGLHQFNHNAFAYHVALDGNVVDLSSNKQPRLYNDHVLSIQTREGDITTWEVAISIFDQGYMDGARNERKRLTKQKKMGFALAYSDNDGSLERENFIGSVFVPDEEKNLWWINADIFGTLVLQE